MSDTTTPEEAEPVLEATEQRNAAVYLWLTRLEEVRAQIDLLEDEARHLTRALERAVPRTARYTDQLGIPWQATVVRPDDTVLVNLDLVASMRPDLYARITKVALDRNALNKALRAGAVDREVAAAAMTTRPNAPSIRLTRLDQEQTEESTDD